VGLATFLSSAYASKTLILICLLACLCATDRDSWRRWASPQYVEVIFERVAA
jgi:hypothetical protein